MAEPGVLQRNPGGVLPEFADATWGSLLAETRAPLECFDPAMLDGLPPPAQRLLSRALPAGTPLSQLVELGMEGEIKLGGRWLPFTARQILRAGRGFVWAPTVGGRVLRFSGADALGLNGARIEFRLYGRIPVVRGSGADISRSAQGRLAAETVAWLPHALTPQAGARWVGLDDHRAIVTLDAAGTDVDVEINVDDDGQLVWLGLQRWNDTAEPPDYASFGGSVDATFAATNGVGIAGSGAVGWEWNTAREPDGVFFRYRITSAAFPAASPDGVIDDAVIGQLVRAAVQAPSSHNTQPWRFAPIDGGVAVFADRSRDLPVNDPCDRELTISCGTAIHNTEAAARNLGFEPTVRLRPDPTDQDRLADVHLDLPATAVDATGPSVLGSRHTTRQPFDADATLELDELVDTAECGGQVTFTVIGPDRRQVLAALIAEGDRTQFANARWRRELAMWMRPRRRGDGLVVPAITGSVARMIVSRFNVGESTAKKDHELTIAAPLVVVVGSERDDSTAWIEVGQHLQSLLLQAARLGVQAGFLNQPCQVAHLREQLTDLVPEAGFPQLILRFGHPIHTSKPTPRRPITDVISESQAE